MKDGDEKKDGAEATPTSGAPASKGENESSVPWPLRDIKEPHEHDVLYGRGGGTNHHMGNKRYRKMVEDKKVDYVNSKRLDKPLVALNIIRQWREQDPPGRFLKLDEKTGLWHDVGDKKAREKTSQALREKAPELRKQQEVGKPEKDGDLASDEVGDKEPKHKGKDRKSRGKKTAFNVPEEEHKKRDRKDIKHLMLARDHSLGRDYLKPNEQVDLDGFSWDEPVGEIYREKEGSYGRQRQDRASFPPAREGWGSGRFANLEPSSTSMPPPPPGPYPSHSAGGEFQSMMPPPETQVSREHSLAMNPLPDAAVDGPAKNPFPRERKSVSGGGLDEAWARGPTHPPHQPYGFPPPARQTSQSRYLSNEGSSAFSRTPSTQGSDRTRRTSASAEEPRHRSRSSSGRSMGHEYSQGSYNGGSGPSRREWSSQTDDYRKVAGVAGDDPYDIRRSWSGQSDEYTRGPPYPTPDRGPPYPSADGHSYSSHDSWTSHARPYSAVLREGGPPQYSGPPPPQPHGAPHHAPPPRNSPPQSAPSHGSYHHQARRESSGRMSVDEGRGVETGRVGKELAKPNLRRKISGGGVTPRGPPQPPAEAKRGLLARPQPVKRDTSHQCENDETKSRVKRTFVSSRECGVGPSGGAFEDEERMKDLETTLQKSHLNSSVGSSVSSTAKPSTVSAKNRLTTVDAIGMAFEADTSSRSHEPDRAKNEKPSAVSAKNRLTTNDAIGMAFAGSPPKDIGTASSKGNADESSPPSDVKPETITAKNRLSTEEAIGIALAKPQSLSEDQRLTSLGDPLEGDDLLIDPVSADEALGAGELSESATASKPGHLSAKQRVTTVDALLMEIEDEVDALSRPDHLTTGKRKDTITAITAGLNDDAIAQAWLGN